jgi:hypothetical protein
MFLLSIEYSWVWLGFVRLGFVRLG